MGPHSSTLAWKIPWTEEPGRLQTMRSLRVGHDWAISLSLFSFMRWRRKWQPTPVFLPGESQGQGSLVGLKLNIGQSYHFMANWRRKSGSSDFYFLGFQNYCGRWLQPWKTLLSLRKVMTSLENESESRSVTSDSLWPHGLYSAWNSPGQNTGVCSLSLLQQVFPTRESNPGLPHCKRIDSLSAEPQRKPLMNLDNVVEIKTSLCQQRSI